MTMKAVMALTVESIKKSSILEPKGQWSWYLVFSIGDVGPT